MAANLTGMYPMCLASKIAKIVPHHEQDGHQS